MSAGAALWKWLGLCLSTVLVVKEVLLKFNVKNQSKKMLEKLVIFHSLHNKTFWKNISSKKNFRTYLDLTLSLKVPHGCQGRRSWSASLSQDRVALERGTSNFKTRVHITSIMKFPRTSRLLVEMVGGNNGIVRAAATDFQDWGHQDNRAWRHHKKIASQGSWHSRS